MQKIKDHVMLRTTLMIKKISEMKCNNVVTIDINK
jgi:hypothetical protein